MEKVLVRFTDNWADEMDIDQFCILPLDIWNRYSKIIKSLPYPFEVYFGTNESNEYSPLDYLKCFEIELITEHEEEVITKFLDPTLGLHMDDHIINQHSEFKDYSCWNY